MRGWEEGHLVALQHGSRSAVIRFLVEDVWVGAWTFNAKYADCAMWHSALLGAANFTGETDKIQQ